MPTRPRHKSFDSSENALLQAIDLITQAVFLIDPSDQILLANNAAQTMTGLPESALLGNSIDTILSLKQLSHHKAKIPPTSSTPANPLTLTATVHGLKYSATFVPLSTLTYFTNFKPRPAALVIVTPLSSPHIHDHTTTTIYVQFIGNLTMRITHDLSNSLTSIVCNAELVREQLNDFLDSPTAELCASLRETGLLALLDVIRKSREMAQFIDTLREYAGQQPVNRNTLDLNNAINETLPMVRSLLGRKIQIEFHPSEELPSIHIDRFRIDQLLLSILLTCKNAMPTGGSIIIETTRAILDSEFALTHRGARPGTYTLLSIKDSSPGLDSEQLTRVFDFPASEIFDSAALSLQIVYSILKRFGGYISVESCAGNGTRFDLYLPSLSATPSTSATRQEPGPISESHESSRPAHGSLILVADDDSDIQQTIARYVSRAGYQTTFAADGKTALDLYTRLAAEENEPALIIADLGLPEIDGRTLSLTVQKQFPSARILLTSGYKVDTNSAGKTADGFHFLPKPFEPHALISTIERLLKQ
jgi:two-component system cell cycle sensor histidine kinase/response regulator CckA